jgi:hypothetical protein
MIQGSFVLISVVEVKEPGSLQYAPPVNLSLHRWIVKFSTLWHPQGMRVLFSYVLDWTPIFDQCVIW